MALLGGQCIDSSANPLSFVLYLLSVFLNPEKKIGQVSLHFPSCIFQLPTVESKRQLTGKEKQI